MPQRSWLSIRDMAGVIPTDILNVFACSNDMRESCTVGNSKCALVMKICVLDAPDDDGEISSSKVCTVQLSSNTNLNKRVCVHTGEKLLGLSCMFKVSTVMLTYSNSRLRIDAIMSHTRYSFLLRVV